MAGRAGAAIVSFRLLGRFEIGAEGGAPVRLAASGRRGRALLAYLALRPDFTETRERLATLLWGDRFDRQARQSLRQCLASLRKDCEAIGVEFLRIDQEIVGFDPTSLSVDARALPKLAQSTEPHDVDAAIELYRGDFLDGLHLGSETFDAWAMVERERLRGFAALALEKSAESHSRIGDGPAAIAAGEKLVALDPLNEHAQRTLLATLSRHGGCEIALARAAALTRLIRSELKADPEPETLATIEAIRPGEFALPPAATMGASLEQAEPISAVRPTSIFSEIVHSGPATGGPSARRRFRVVVATVGLAIASVCALAAAVLFLASRDHFVKAPERPVTTSSRSWQPPGILASVGIDQAALGANGISAVIVLPFTCEPDANDGGSQHLAHLLTNGLIDDLSHIAQIRVIARQTSQLYEGHPVDVAAIGTELGVRYVIDGSVQYQAPRLRITVSLIDTVSRLEIWSQQFDRDYDRRFEAQDEIIHALTRALHLGVVDAEDRRRPAGPRDATLDDLLARGWAAMTKLVDLGTTAGADHYFEQALNRDPENVSALIGLGGYHASIVALFLVAEADDHLVVAERLLRQAIAKSPSSVMSYYYLGLVDKLRGHLPEALDDFTKVVERNPSLPLAYAQVGHLISRMGKPDEAMEYVRYAIRLNPKDPNIALIGLMAGEIELERGQDQAALTWLERSVTLQPLDPFPHAALAAALALNERSEEAASQVSEVRRLAPWLTLERMLDRLTITSQAGHEPDRLIDGLRKAFAGG
jgi:TolB-like protein/DNA-binding SARP family transcriptional activator/Tfp pilus assembly protein PilF